MNSIFVRLLLNPVNTLLPRSSLVKYFLSNIDLVMSVNFVDIKLILGIKQNCLQYNLDYPNMDTSPIPIPLCINRPRLSGL